MMSTIHVGIIFGVLYTVYGYQTVFNHNKEFWMSQHGNGFQYHYSPQSSMKWQSLDHNWRMSNVPQRKDLLSKPHWKNPMSKPQWRTIVSKPKWRNPLSKPHWNPVSKPRSMSKPQWNKPVIRTTMPSVPPAKPAFDFASREWPEYIPPITMIKPRMDDPPEA